MTRTYWAILNEPYGRASGPDGRRIGRLVRFDTKGERDLWCSEATTNYVDQNHSRDAIPAHSPEVRQKLYELAAHGVVADNPDELPERGYCPSCGLPYYWESDEAAHDSLACFERTYA